MEKRTLVEAAVKVKSPGLPVVEPVALRNDFVELAAQMAEMYLAKRD